jgi:hypothetical protein
MPPSNDPLRGAQDSYAGNPCLMQLDAKAWLAAHPAHLVLTGGLFLAGVVLLFKIPGLGLVLMFVPIVALFQTAREIRGKYLKGDVCPAVVISAQQNLIAVYTNLAAASRKPHPAIKILKQPLVRLPEPAYDGMRLATVAYYSGHISWQHWRDFSPEAVACVVHDPEENARVLNSIPPIDWQALDEWLAGIPVAHPGLYRMWEMTKPDGSVAENYVMPGTPWFKRKPAIIGLSIFGSFAALVLAFYLLGIFLNWHNRHRAAPVSPPPAAKMMTPPPVHFHHAAPVEPPAGTVATAPTPSAVSTGAAKNYAADAAVLADWAGGWIPGTITKVNPGGFSVMVKLNDTRFPFPIVLSTNQVRLK